MGIPAFEGVLLSSHPSISPAKHHNQYRAHRRDEPLGVSSHFPYKN
jgi:hypothetical protein